MACFSFEIVKNILIWLVILGAAVALIQLILPLVLGSLGAAGEIVIKALKIVIWAVVAIFLILLIFDLIACLFGLGGGLRIR